MSALLDGAPSVDIVVIVHVGLDAFPDLRSLVRNVPLVRPVRVTARRISRRSVPTDPAARLEWLDGIWQEFDEWIENRREL